MTLTDRQQKILLFLAGALPCLLLALFTDHAWEDWYITYRAGKNLALGNGLVYQPGQVLHTFTSPINVLLPALLSYMLDNRHDEAVLWLYRVIGALFLGGTALLLHRFARLQHLSRTPMLFLFALFVLDFKTMDFSINGQEAAFLVFFHALNLLALIERKSVWLGIAWAGLMWSRPDSFIYIAASNAVFAVSVAVASRSASVLSSSLRGFAIAGLVAVLLYGPWIAWATWYYGTPIPHTIVAKGLSMHPSPGDLLLKLLLFPLKLVAAQSAAQYQFMPIYYVFGGWPAWMKWIANSLACIAALAWLMPGMTASARAASATVFAGLFYLSYLASFPYPWYFPAITVYAAVGLSGFAQAVGERFRHRAETHDIITGLCVATCLVLSVIAVESAWQLRVQQQVIELGNRKQIGLWLHDHAHTPKDTVFLECLGYIGFYSGLKMYDYPGMSSPEMVAARRQYGEHWLQLILHLKPDWLVLRAREARGLAAEDPDLLSKDYQTAAVFDQSQRLRNYHFLPGRGYLEYDETFVVFHREATDF